MMKMVMVGKIEMMWVNWTTSPIKINPAIAMMFILLMPLSRWIDETCLSSKEPPALADDFAKAMIVQLLNVLQPSSSIIFSHIFCNQNLKYCQTTHRVGKCHGYDGYIRVKTVGVKSLGSQNYCQKQVIFGKICAKKLRSMDKLP